VRAVQRLGVRGGVEQAAVWEPASDLAGVGLHVADVIDGHWQRKAAMDHQWAGLAAIGGGGVFGLRRRDAFRSPFQEKRTYADYLTDLCPIIFFSASPLSLQYLNWYRYNPTISIRNTAVGLANAIFFAQSNLAEPSRSNQKSE
jgi:hypothetical protein